MSDRPDNYWDEEPTIKAAKRLGVRMPVWMGGDWFTSWSPHADDTNAEGQWCQWVHLARLILAHPLTAEQMPEFAVPYPDAPDIYTGHHPACRMMPDRFRHRRTVSQLRRHQLDDITEQGVEA